MYLHIGTNVLLRGEDIIAIIGRKGDADKSKINRFFLNKKAEKGKIINISFDNEKSFILTDEEIVYISPISPQTLKSRSKNNGFSGGSK
jgi:regulator of extracellular matrix RemA (YlzA/DUF370 family)